MALPTSRDSDKFVLRLPDGMRERIKAAAEAGNRSMNAEIVATLEEKYPAPASELESRRQELWLQLTGMDDKLKISLKKMELNAPSKELLIDLYDIMEMQMNLIRELHEIDLKLMPLQAKELKRILLPEAEKRRPSKRRESSEIQED